MSSCSCEYNKKIYAFSSDGPDYFKAQRNCQMQGGDLATNLDEDAYAFLNSCCSDERLYWIGLVKDDICGGNSTHSFHWVKNTTCINASPLQVSNGVRNKCQAVYVQIASPSRSIPAANLGNCENYQRYICQFPASISSIARSNTITKTTLQSSTISYGSSPWHAIGITASVIAILTLVALTYCYCKWRFFQESAKKTHQNSSHSARVESLDVIEHHQYCSISDRERVPSQPQSLDDVYHNDDYYITVNAHPYYSEPHDENAEKNNTNLTQDQSTIGNNGQNHRQTNDENNVYLRPFN